MIDYVLFTNAGKIPRCIFALSTLGTLYLDSNKLSGHLEDVSAPLSSSISEIDLSNNHLHGPLPSSFSQLPSLKYLNLESNRLVGVVELNSFWRLSNLYFLGFSNNMLSVIEAEDGALPPFLPNVQHLGLASCNLTKLPRVLRHLDSIFELDLSSNQIGGIIPGWIWEIWKDTLGKLDLSNNAFTSMQKSSLIPMTHLYFLNLSFNRIQEDIPVPVISLPYGEVSLDYSNNEFSSILRSFGTYLDNVAYINLSKNKLNGHVPASVCSMGKLQILDLSYNNFSGLVPHCLLKGGSLSVLKLRENKFQGTLPENIMEKCIFETIDLNSNQIEGRLPRSLSNCKSLEILDVSNNQILDMFPSWLGSLPKLRVLVLRSNKFYGTIGGLRTSDHTRDFFSSLQILDLASNTFSGNLHSEWFVKLKSMMSSANNGRVLGHKANFSAGFVYYDIITVTYKGLDITFNKMLTTFKAIDFSNNAFNGVIPRSIGRLVSLHGLNMSHNAFMGEIPQQLADLAQLESLDLSWNQLSGEIPQELTSLTFLASLNLSYNNLTGRVPQSNQFFSFSNSSFEGNVGLCGRPLSKQCDTPSPPASSEDNNWWEDKVGVILLFVFSGLGFGVGFTLAIIFRTVCQVKGVSNIFGTWCHNI
jgi:Leucine-rich repeat (LRR) protein